LAEIYISISSYKEKVEKWYEQQEVVALQHFKQIHTLSEYGVRFDMKHLILCTATIFSCHIFLKIRRVKEKLRCDSQTAEM